MKNFANFKKSMVLKSCLCAPVKMGYQCTFGVMQAGQFGIVQTRRRAIILAEAPGQVLPRYPEPEHIFSPQACHLSVEVDGRRFNSQTRWMKSATRKTVTVWDTMSDLPKINHGESKEKRFIPQTKTKTGSEITSVTWDQAELKVGDTVYLSPGSAKIKTKPVKLEKEMIKMENVDEDLYSEYYRKTEHVKWNNFNTPDQFIIARILMFKVEGKEIKLKVGLFYRPESIMKSQDKEEENNMFLLYWSKDTDWVAGSDIKGRCYLRCGEDEYEEVTDWFKKGPDRWVFRHMLILELKGLTLPAEAKEFGSVPADPFIPIYPQVKKKLRSLDIFAECGDLSQDLHDAGVANTHWAVEVF